MTGAATMRLESMPDSVRIGNRLFPFTTYQDISESYSRAIDATGATASGATGPLAPKCLLLKAAKIVGYVSYNGRVWRSNAAHYGNEARMWEDSQCVYEPRSPK